MKKNGSKIKYRVYNTNYIVVYILCLFLCACSKEYIDIPGEKVQVDKDVFFTVEEAQSFFENTRSKQHQSRSLENTEHYNWLQPGVFNLQWNEAIIAESRRLGSANVPMLAAYKYKAKLKKDSCFAEVFQKLLVVKSKRTGKNNIYVLSLIPDNILYSQHDSTVCDKFINSGNKGEFSGMAIYTKINGNIPVTIAVFDKGKRVNKASLLDSTQSLCHRVLQIKQLLKDVRFHREATTCLSRTSNEGGSGEGGGKGNGKGDGKGKGEDGNKDPGDNEDEDEDPDEGWDWDDADYYGYDEELEADIWIAEINGENYFLTDMDGDGKPDTVLEGGVDAFPDDPDDDDYIDPDPYDDDIWGNDKDDDDDDDDDVIDNRDFDEDESEIYEKQDTATISVLDSIIYPKRTNLKKHQLDSLNKMINKFMENSPLFKKMMELLMKRGIKVELIVSSTGSKGHPARYDPDEVVIFIRDDNRAYSATTLEEFIHFAQFQAIYDKSDFPGLKNLEFEAKVFFDICQYKETGSMSSLLSNGFDEDAQREYAEFLDNVNINGLFDKYIQDYHDIGKQWNDPDYRGNYNPDTEPKLIISMFK